MFFEKDNSVPSKSVFFNADSNEEYSFNSINTEIEKFGEYFRLNGKGLVFLLCNQSVSTLIGYLASLRSGHAVLLTEDSQNNELKSQLIEKYRPEFVLVPENGQFHFEGYTFLNCLSSVRFYKRNTMEHSEVFADTALLLSTSGTTGSHRFVRLSYQNIQVNAESIKEYLNISSNDVAITSLPISYSYGLSIINSHLFAGAQIVFTGSSLMQKEFWEYLEKYRCSSLSGVPFTFSMLERLRFERKDLPHLKTLTQAGGRLAAEKIKHFADIAKMKGMKFFVMYGQTEASPRISYIPPENLVEKCDSVGIAIPGGKISVIKEEGKVCAPNEIGEIVYQGPNVMLGYAESRECLEKQDEQKGTLYTGDLGYKDEDGYLYITGRKKRFIKVFGLRINLDEVEAMLESEVGCSVACIGSDDKLILIVETKDPEESKKIKHLVSKKYSLAQSVIQVKDSDAIPVTQSGKRDYNLLVELHNPT